MQPEVIMRAQELDRKLPQLVSRVLNVSGNILRMANFTRPPSTEGRMKSVKELDGQFQLCSLPVHAQLHPDDIAIHWPLSTHAELTMPGSLWRLNVKTLCMICAWTRVTTEQSAPHRAGKAPAHVIHGVVGVAFSRLEVIRANDALLIQLLAASCEAKVTSMVRSGTAHTPQQAIWNKSTQWIHSAKAHPAINPLCLGLGL